MATQRISSRLAPIVNSAEETSLRILLEALQDDLTALRNAHVTLAAKLDADAGVTDTNYGALTNPAALTFTK